MQLMYHNRKRPIRAFPKSNKEYLDNSSLLESSECSVLLDSLEPFHRNVHDDGFAELRDIDAALLEIGLAADLTGRVILRCSGAVGVPPADLGRLAGDFAGSCHGRRMVA